jgi:RHS repeat-associated protein
MRLKATAIIMSLAIFSSTLAAAVPASAEDVYKTPETKTGALPDAPLVQNLYLKTNQTSEKPLDVVKLEAITDAPVEPSGDSVNIVNSDTGQTVKTCKVGTTCAYDYTRVDYAADPTFYAKTTQLTSNEVSVANDIPTIVLRSNLDEVQTEDHYFVFTESEGTLPEGKGVFITNTFSGEVVENCDQLKKCSAGAFVMNDEPDRERYKAYIADQNFGAANVSELTNIVTESNLLVMTRVPWEVTIASDQAIVNEGSRFDITVRANQTIPDDFELYIYDMTGKRMVSEATSNPNPYEWCFADFTIEEKCGTSFAYDPFHTYKAIIAESNRDDHIVFTSTEADLRNVKASSGLLTVKQKPFDISLQVKASGTTWGGIKYLGMSNQGTINYYSAILDTETGKILQLCNGPDQVECETLHEYPDWFDDYFPAKGVSFVIGRWSEDHWDPGSDSGSNKPGYMYDIQARVDTTSTVPTTAPKPDLSNPGAFTGGSNPSQPCAQTCEADPINVITGELSLEETDVKVTSSTPLAMSRYYAISKRNTLSDMGYGWNSNYNMSLKPNASTTLDTSPLITVSQENGSTISFTKNAAGGYSTDLKTRATLVKENGSYVLTRNKDTKFIFNNAGLLTSVTDTKGHTVTLAYTAGKLATATNDKGQKLTFTWNAAGLIASVTTPAGKTTTYTYTASKNLSKVTYADGTFVSYVYNGEHMIMDFYDQKNNKTTNVYDAEKRTTAQIDAALNKTIFEYKPLVTTITQPNGRKDKHYFNSKFQVYQIQYAEGAEEEYNEHYEYDAAGNLIKTTFPNGSTTENLYNASNNLVQQKDELGNISTFTHNALGQAITETNPAGKTRAYTYDAKGNLTASTDFKGATFTLTLNPDGTVQKKVSPTGATTTYQYNTQGLVSSQLDPVGGTTTQLYSLDGEPTTITDPRGKTVTKTYDSYGRVTQITHPNGSTEKYAFDANSNITQITDRLGKITTKTYDVLNRPLATTDPLNRITSQQYDKMGNTVKITDAAGKITTSTYDTLNHQLTLTNANTQTTTFTYNNMGNVTEIIDPLGHKVTYKYDAAGNNIQSTDSKGLRTSTTYNKLGLKEKAVNTQRQQTLYTYDDNGNLIKTQLPNGAFETQTFDGESRRTTFVDSEGKTKKWSYDNGGRVLSFTNTNNELTSYTYDPAGNMLTETRPGGSVVTYEYSDTNQVVKEIYSDSTTEFFYNAADAVTKEKQGPDEVLYTYDDAQNILTRGPAATGTGVTYTYTPRNEIATITYPSTKKVTYTYDNIGKMVRASNAQTGAYVYTYDEAGRLTTATTPNTVKQENSYSDNNKLIGTELSKGTTKLYGKTYEYSEATGSMESSVTSSETNTFSEDYTYDNMGRLASSTSDQTTSGAYKYSSTGNLTTKLNEAQTFNASNQLASSNVQTDMLYTSDVRGNRTIQRDATSKIIDRNYAYNQRNQLAGTGSYGETVYYAYDANGLLKRRTKNAVDKKFVWNYTNPVPTLLDDGDYEYIYGVGTAPVAQITKATGKVTYLHSAETGSVVLATSNTGTVAGSYAYTAYGDIEAPDGAVDPQHLQTRFGYAGEWKDPETGLYNLRARWYDPKAGTFLTRDPMEQKTNEAYSYASGNPLTNVDPLGLATLVSDYGAAEPIPFSGYGSSLVGPDIGGITNWAVKHGPNYSYAFEWDMGSTDDFSAEQLMSAFQKNPQDVFPFDIYGCETFEQNDTCTLAAFSVVPSWAEGFVDKNARGVLNLGINGIAHGYGDVKISNTCVSTTFTVSSDGYFDPKGSQVTFSAKEKDGRVIFSQHTAAEGAYPIVGLGISGAKASRTAAWKPQADNLQEHMDKK